MGTRIPDNGSPNANFIPVGDDPKNSIKVAKNQDTEPMKQTLRDPNASIDDTMKALGELYLSYGTKIADGTASDDEKKQHKLIEDLRGNRISDSDRDQLQGRLSMFRERMAEVQKQFQI